MYELDTYRARIAALRHQLKTAQLNDLEQYNVEMQIIQIKTRARIIKKQIKMLGEE